MKDRVWQVYDMIIMPGLLCPAVPYGWREGGGSVVWRHPTCNVKVNLKDDFFIGTPDRSSLSHGHVHMLSLCTDFCSGFDIFYVFPHSVKCDFVTDLSSDNLDTCRDHLCLVLAFFHFGIYCFLQIFLLC